MTQEITEIDPDSGEVLSYEASPEALDLAAEMALEATIDPVTDQWGELATELLANITDGPHFRKKRRTLLKLAEASYLNIPMSTVFLQPDTCSKMAHYKWRDVDPDYENAYAYLIGDPQSPGIAKITREQELDEDEALAISALVQARTTLRLGTAAAANTLMNALDASDRTQTPLWRERIVAANSILAYADNQAGGTTGPNVTLIEQAIMVTYADPAHRQTGLHDVMSNTQLILEGEVEEDVPPNNAPTADG